jgi:DNA-binding response OmpR family regulator
MRIAIVDDDPVQLETVSAAVEDAGLKASTFPRAGALISALRRDTYDLLIVDWNLPDRSGLEVIHWARSNIDPAPPILLVTSRTDDADIVAGLEAGADDYLAKPVSVPVLVARVRALIRRAYPAAGAPVGPEVHAGLTFEPGSTTVTIGESEIVLTAKEFALALALFRNLHRALSRAWLIETVWGGEPDLNSRSLDMHVSRVRSKLQLRPEFGFRLAPVYSYGYRLERLNSVQELQEAIS